MNGFRGAASLPMESCGGFRTLTLSPVAEERFADSVCFHNTSFPALNLIFQKILNFSSSAVKKIQDSLKISAFLPFYTQGKGGGLHVLSCSRKKSTQTGW